MRQTPHSDGNRRYPVRVLGAELNITAEPVATAWPELHGHFVEQLFGCVNGGILDHMGEVRPLILQKSQALGLELIRWPGGCFADTYNWMDGVGPRASRPVTVTNRWGEDEIENHNFGSHEFLAFCTATGAKPWINLNLGTASPREAYAWMEYLTYAGDTTMANLRRKHGRAEPYRVDFWGVGNECWDCGGKFTPDEYAEAYRRFESAIPRFRDVPRQLILCGPDGNKPHEREVWTDTVLRELTQWRVPAVHALDAHFYVWGDEKGTGTSGSFNQDQFSGMLWRAREIEPVMIRQWEILQGYDKRIQLFVGEWGPWHADAFGNRFWQRVTMRDAVLISLTLDLFTNHADKIRAATYTQLCNILGSPFQTLDDVAYATPVYHAFGLHKPHRGREVVKSTPRANAVRFKAPEGHMLENPGISACVTRGARDFYITASNLHPTEDIELTILPPAGVRFGEASAQGLFHADPQAFNDAAQPDRIRAVSHPVTAAGDQLVIHLPAASVAGIRVLLA